MTSETKGDVNPLTGIARNEQINPRYAEELLKRIETAAGGDVSFVEIRRQFVRDFGKRAHDEALEWLSRAEDLGLFEDDES